MGVPAYFTLNKVDGNTTITTSTADATHSAANMFDEDVASLFRFTTASGGNIEFDLGSGTNFDTVGIYRHNFNSTASVVIKHGNGPAPSTIFQSGITYQADNLIALTASVSARYVAVNIADTRAAGASEFGEILIGTRTLFPRGYRFGHTLGAQQELVQERTNRGKLWVLQLFTFRTRRYEFKFPKSELTQFQAIHSAVEGPIKPIGWIEDVATAQTIYMRKEAGYIFQEDSTPAASAVFTYTLQLTEEPPGADILA